MSQRLYISPLVQVPGPQGLTQTVPLAATYPNQGYRQVVDITGAHNWSLVVLEAQDHTPILNDAQITALPDYAFDGDMKGMAAGVRNGFANALNRLGISGDVTYSNADAWRTVLRKIGKLHDASFNEDAFSVSLR